MRFHRGVDNHPTMKTAAAIASMQCMNDPAAVFTLNIIKYKENKRWQIKM